MLCPEYIHQFIACPAENAEAVSNKTFIIVVVVVIVIVYLQVLLCTCLCL